MAAPFLFVTQVQLESRLSGKRIKRMYDDDGNGTADLNPVKQLRQDASSKVASYLEPLGIISQMSTYFDGTTGEVVSGDVTVHPEIIRLTLDVAQAMAAQRHPTIWQIDWCKLMEAAEGDLKNLRDGKTSLGGNGAPEVANQGAFLVSGNTATENATTQRFWDDMGDF